MSNRTGASSVCRNLTLVRPLVFFDLETTGTTVGVDRIVELAVIKLWPDGTQTSYEWRFNPQMSIPEEATRIHGIRDEDVKDKPIFSTLLSEMREVFRDSDVAGFNIARFDLPMLQSELQRAGTRFDMSTRHIVDAMTIFHIMEPRNLSAAYQLYCNKELEHAHSALADVSATVEILRSQVLRYADLPMAVPELAAFGGRTNDQYKDQGRWFVKRAGKLLFAKGKHRGSDITDVAKTDANYLEWMANNLDLPTDTAQFVHDALREVKQPSVKEAIKATQ
jgi:DNA polymerase-3 subunit epsilon